MSHGLRRACGSSYIYPAPHTAVTLRYKSSWLLLISRRHADLTGRVLHTAAVSASLFSNRLQNSPSPDLLKRVFSRSTPRLSLMPTHFGGKGPNLLAKVLALSLFFCHSIHLSFGLTWTHMDLIHPSPEENETHSRHNTRNPGFPDMRHHTMNPLKKGENFRIMD